MSNLIEEFISSAGFSPVKANNTALKETLEWKNLFDKEMLKFFDHDKNQKADERVIPRADFIKPEKNINAESNVYKVSPDKSNNVSNNFNNIEKISVDNTRYSFENSSTKTLSTNSVFSAYNSSDKVVMQMKNTGACSSLAEKNAFRFPSDSISHNLARIHLIKTKEGIKLFMRDYGIDKHNVLENLKNIVAKINFSGITIEELKLNGKVVKL